MPYIPTPAEVSTIVQRYKNYSYSQPEKYEELKREYLSIFKTGFGHWDPIPPDSWRGKNRPKKSFEYFCLIVEAMSWQYEQ